MRVCVVVWLCGCVYVTTVVLAVIVQLVVYHYYDYYRHYRREAVAAGAPSTQADRQIGRQIDRKTYALS